MEETDNQTKAVSRNQFFYHPTSNTLGRICKADIETAKALTRKHGLGCAARFLCLRGWSFNAAHLLLLGSVPRRKRRQN